MAELHCAHPDQRAGRQRIAIQIQTLVDLGGCRLVALSRDRRGHHRATANRNE
jgi:hypothetical protein